MFDEAMSIVRLKCSVPSFSLATTPSERARERRDATRTDRDTRSVCVDQSNRDERDLARGEAPALVSKRKCHYHALVTYFTVHISYVYCRLYRSAQWGAVYSMV